MKKIDFTNKTILFCDLDGTLINTINGETFPKGIWDMKLRFDVLDVIRALHPKYVFIVSNQGGIEKEHADIYNFIAKSEYITRSISEYCDCECYAKYCDINDKSYPYRKPNTGMLEYILKRYIGDDFECVKQKSLMIGDASGKNRRFSGSDKKTAENFGIDYMNVNDFVNVLL